MTHALAPYLGQRDFDTTLLTDHASMLEPLVFTAQTFVVLDRSKYPSAKQAVPFRFEGTIVDGLWFFNLTERPF